MRVVAGALGGRTLVAPRGRETRPTTERVREALFSILGDVTGARVLDLYAGSGALGIEALSRGAASAVFVESGRPALAALAQNLDALGLSARAQVIAKPAERARGLSGPFDLVLCDPPWRDLAAAARVLAGLTGALAPGARVVLEHAARDQPPPLPFAETGRRTYGDTALLFCEPSEAPPDTGERAR